MKKKTAKKKTVKLRIVSDAEKRANDNWFYDSVFMKKN